MSYFDVIYDVYRCDQALARGVVDMREESTMPFWGGFNKD
jgi:hypothetical protein